MSEVQTMPEAFQNGPRYLTYSRFLRQRFGQKVYRISVDGGFTCPNVDGTVTTGGCVYCDNRSFSPSRREKRIPIREQIQRGMAIMQKRHSAKKFLAYFQPATNTHAPVEKLQRLYDEALEHPDIVGLLIGTRPDSVPDPVLDLIENYAKDYYVSLELGLQTIHDRSLDWMNRGHHFDVFVDAMERATGRGFEICAHVILGLPGESREDMLAIADAIAVMPIDAIKIHNLHVVKNTPLEQQYLDGEVRMLEREEYVQLVCDFLERVPSHVIVQRLNGDAPKNYLIAPQWCLEKTSLLQSIRDELVRRDSWQGKSVVGRSAAVERVRKKPVVSLPLA